MRDNLLGVSEPTQQRKSGRGWKILLGVIIGLILIAVVGYGIDYFGNRDTVARGTSVGGVEIGGLTPAEAEEKLRAELGGVETRPVTVTAGEQDAVMHRLLSLSGGTADGLYLAVRLSICRLLLPASAPIVLDDALAMLDDTRLRLALQLLQQEADSRQILLFTCQSREAQALQN